MLKTTALAAILVAVPALAHADTLVGAGGKPGVATSWKSDGGAVVLQIKEGFSVSEIATAIIKAVPGARCETGEGIIKVSGVKEKVLLAALERVQVDPELDDVDAAFAALQGGGDDSDSGSSIRATKAATIPGHEAETITGTIVGVNHKKFPLVALRVKTDAGDSVTVVPHITVRGGIIASDDQQSQQNVSAWYARPGDKVKFTVGEKREKIWIASAFERVR